MIPLLHSPRNAASTQRVSCRKLPRQLFCILSYQKSGKKSKFFPLPPGFSTPGNAAEKALFSKGLERFISKDGERCVKINLLESENFC